MAGSAATKNVFVDTEVFDRHQLVLDAPSFQRLVRLAAEGDLRLVLTTVTEAEIRAHIAEQADKSYKQIQNFKRILPPARKVITPEMHATALPATSADQFRQSHLDAFDKFLADTKAVVLSIDDVSPEAIFKDYFECNPPFGEGDKKFEFPDAFAAAAIKAWAQEEGDSIFIVSADKDWRRVCQKEPALIHQEALGELLENFSDAEVVIAIRQAVSDGRSAVKELLDEEATGLCFFTSDGVEPEIEGPEDVDVSIDDFHVIEVREGEAIVSLACTLSYTVTIDDADPDSGYSDPDDGDRRYVYRRSGSVEGIADMDAVMTVQFDPENPEDVTFLKVAFDQQDVDVSFDDSDLTRSRSRPGIADSSSVGQQRGDVPA